MAQIVQKMHQDRSAAAKNQSAVKAQSLEIVSADYQPEREEYLEKIGAVRVEQTLLMSRSVWRKIREAKPLEGLQLSDMLQGLKPARTPIPSRISLFKAIASSYQNTVRQKNIFSSKYNYFATSEEINNTKAPKPPSNGHHA